MARSLGIHLRPDGFSYVLLDGSARKWSLLGRGEGGLDPDEADPAAALAASLEQGLKGAGLRRNDQVVLTLPSNDAVLRELSLPFSDRDKIHQVLKFEVESDLYHLDIDEVVCDYLELADDRATATLLVAAQPKSRIGVALEVAQEAGLDPPVLDLDLGALAVAVGTIPPDPEQPEALQASLYVDSFASLLLVHAPEGLRAARKIPLGWRELGRGLVEEAAAAAGEPETAALEVQTADEEAAAGGPAAPVEAEEPAEEAPRPLFGADAGLPLRLGLDEVLDRCPDEARASFLRRLSAEVRRGLAALGGPTVSRIHLLGADVPGLAEALQQRLGFPTARFEPAGEGEGAAAPVDPVAFGAALRGLGGAGSEMNFRQEEYRQTGSLERLEGPLTLMLVGLIAFLLVDSVILFKRARDVLVPDNEALYQAAAAEVKKLNDELRPEDPESWFIKGVEGLDLDDLQRIQVLRSRVKKARKDLDEMLGEGDLVHPQSCLEAWRLIFGLLDRELEQNFDGRWMLEGLDLTSQQPRSRDVEPYVEAKIRLTVFGDEVSASRKFDDLLSAFRIQDWVIDSPTYGGEVTAAADGAARTGTIIVHVSTVKAVES